MCRLIAWIPSKNFFFCSRNSLTLMVAIVQTGAWTKLLPYQWSHWQRKAQFNAVEVPPRFAIANKLITDFVSPGKVPTICPDTVVSIVWDVEKGFLWFAQCLGQTRSLSFGTKINRETKMLCSLWCLCGSTMRSCVQFVIFVLGAIWKRKLASSTVSCYLGCWSLGLWV